MPVPQLICSPCKGREGVPALFIILSPEPISAPDYGKYLISFI